MRKAAGGLALALLAAGCSGHSGTTPTRASAKKSTHRRSQDPQQLLVSPLGLPRVHSKIVPGYVLIADRNNNRALIVSPSKQIVWQNDTLRGPDDAFFTPGYRSVITNEEFNDTLVELSLKSQRRVWSYGHSGVAGSSPGYLNTPDDAYRLPSGLTTVADIRNCRIVQLDRRGQVVRVLGGSCVHDPPRGFASPNGDTPLPDGGLLVTEIGGWIDRLGPAGNLLWTIRSPVPYPSDAQLLPDGQVLVASFAIPGRIVVVNRSGAITWSFGDASGPNRLAKPSLAVRWPNGLIAANDDYNHRVIVINPRTKRIVWQYGHTGVAGNGRGYLSKPDGLDLLPATDLVRAPAATATRAALAHRLRVSRIGSLPQTVSRLAAVALADGRVLALGGLVGGASSDEVLLGPPERLRNVGRLPVPTHDAAAAQLGRSAYLFGGGEAVSTDAVIRVDPATAHASRVGSLGEPLSDLGVASLAGKTYLVGGYTGARYATAVLRFQPGRSPRVVARLPQGLRYAGVTTLGGRIYVAGGLTTSGVTRAVLVVDPAAGTVTQVAMLPRPLDHVALAALGSRLVLVGGGSRQVLEVDPRTGNVSVAALLPRPLADPAAVARGGRVIVLGGGTNAVYALG
jgi:hypothetical protein